MPTMYRIFLILLIGGAALACIASGISQQHGVVTAGGMAALLCLAGLAAPIPLEENPVRSRLSRFFHHRAGDSYPATQSSAPTQTSRSAPAEASDGSLAGEM